MMPRRLATLTLLSAASALSATATRRSPLTVAPPSNDQLVIAGKSFNSRLFLGTGKYKTAQDMADSIAASEAEVVTVAVRRVEGAVTSMLETSIDWDKVWLLPNTAGCTTAEDAALGCAAQRAMAWLWQTTVTPSPNMVLAMSIAVAEVLTFSSLAMGMTSLSSSDNAAAPRGGAV